MKWRNSDSDKLKREINKFNKRLYYQERKNPEIKEQLPPRKKYSEIKSSITTRADFNKVISELQKPVVKSNVKGAIRWSKDDSRELKNMVRRFNRKIDRVLKNNPEYAATLPEKRLAGVLKDKIITRNDYKHVIGEMNRFLKDGAEKTITNKHGVSASRWEISERKRNQRALIKKAERSKKKLGEEKLSIADEEQDVTLAEMGNISEYVDVSSKQFESYTSLEKFKESSDLLNKRMYKEWDLYRENLLMENYLKGLIDQGFSDDIIDILNYVPKEEFIKIVRKDKIASIKFIYDPIELAIREDYIRNLWTKHKGEVKVNNFDIEALTDYVEQRNKVWGAEGRNKHHYSKYAKKPAKR